MALDLNLKISTANDCTSLVIQDVTGPYHSESNPGGWGGFNINGVRANFTLNIIVTYFIVSNGKIDTLVYPVPYDSMYFPSEDTYRGFKFSESFYTILNSGVYPLGVEDRMSEYIKNTSAPNMSLDGMYQIKAQIVSSPGGLIIDEVQYTYSKMFEYKNICQTEKSVNKLLGTINLECEDCDDKDIEKALLAKSLLNSIKSI